MAIKTEHTEKKILIEQGVFRLSVKTVSHTNGEKRRIMSIEGLEKFDSLLKSVDATEAEAIDAYHSNVLAAIEVLRNLTEVIKSEMTM